MVILARITSRITRMVNSPQNSRGCSLLPPHCLYRCRLLLPVSACRRPILSQDEQKIEICKEALKALRRASVFAHSPNRTLCDKTSLHIWPGSISQDFLELIYRRDPRALVILAHYCALLKKNNHVWCLRGIGSGLLENIWQALGEEWRPLIQWPIGQPVS